MATAGNQMSLAIGLLVAALVYLAIRWLIAKGRTEYSGRAAKFNEINSIPLEQARLRAMSLLHDKNLFICDETQPNQPLATQSLPSGILELFQKYATIRAVSAGSPRIERSLIGQEARQQPYKLVGRGMEGSDVEFDLGVLPGDERLYEIYSKEPPDPSAGIYSSIFHWVLVTAARSL
jgi:hypothetical protein